MGYERLSEVFELGDTPNNVPEKEENLKKKRKRVGNLIDEAFDYCSREGGLETPNDKMELKDRENSNKGLRHYEKKREEDMLESFVGFRSAEVRRGNGLRIIDLNALNLREEEQPANNIQPQRIININAIDEDDKEEEEEQDKRREEDGIELLSKKDYLGTCGCCFNFGREDENEDFPRVENFFEYDGMEEEEERMEEEEEEERMEEEEEEEEEEETDARLEFKIFK